MTGVQQLYDDVRMARWLAGSADRDDRDAAAELLQSVGAVLVEAGATPDRVPPDGPARRRYYAELTARARRRAVDAAARQREALADAVELATRAGAA